MECFDQGLKMAEKYLGNEHYFVHKFFQRKSFTPNILETSPPPPPPIAAFVPSNEAAEPEEYVYYEPQPTESPAPPQPEGIKYPVI